MSTESSRIALVFGTRPEIIKMAPIVHELAERGWDHVLVHTGQHYSDLLNDVFFQTLNLPKPDFNLGVGSETHGKQTGAMIEAIEEILLDEEFGTVLVQGDTNSALAGSIATSKLPIRLGHVEAGLRSYDRQMPEEINRVLSDHASDYFFAPTETAKSNLLEEGIDDDRIYVTGNTIVDAVQDHAELADRESTILEEFELDGTEYGLVTVHRAENVDDPARIVDILAGIGQFLSDCDIEGVYPVHPRTQKQFDQHDIEVPDRIRLVDPLDFFDFLVLEDNASIIFTDSGGVQEEACILGTPCVTLRDSTERPETVAVGANKLAGTDPASILSVGREMIEQPSDWECPIGDGTAATQILDVLSKSDDEA